MHKLEIYVLVKYIAKSHCKTETNSKNLRQYATQALRILTENMEIRIYVNWNS